MTTERSGSHHQPSYQKPDTLYYGHLATTKFRRQPPRQWRNYLAFWYASFKFRRVCDRGNIFGLLACHFTYSTRYICTHFHSIHVLIEGGKMTRWRSGWWREFLVAKFLDTDTLTTMPPSAPLTCLILVSSWVTCETEYTNTTQLNYLWAVFLSAGGYSSEENKRHLCSSRLTVAEQKERLLEILPNNYKPSFPDLSINIIK